MSSDDERLNRYYWDQESGRYQVEHADQLDAAPLAWGVWRVPEQEIKALGDPARYGRVLELGCGGGQWAIALARAGAEVIGLDLSSAQLGHAATGARRAGVRVPLVHASAEVLPFPDASFDLVFCDHGALTFADPDHSIPEVARVLRPGGRLVFCGSSPLRAACLDRDWKVRARLHRPAFETMRLADDHSVDYVLSHGETIRRLRAAGLDVVDLIELRAPEGASTTYPWFVPYEWARQWPAEDVWVAIRRREGLSPAGV